MILSSRLKFALAAWLLAEALLFVAIVHLVGVGGAVLLGLASTLIGFSLLKRAGQSAMVKMRAAFATRATVGGGTVANETLTGVGAVALIIPGFLSDVVGIVLVTPMLRDPLAAFIGRKLVSGARTGRSVGPQTIDLDPDDWRRTDPRGGTLPRGGPAGSL